MTMDDLWYISRAECLKHLLDEENYGYGLYQRRMKKGLPVNEETVQKHKESYEFWKELYCYKLLTDQGKHWPIRVQSPRWEMEQQLEWWTCYFSYSWQGAKTDRKPVYQNESVGDK